MLESVSPVSVPGPAAAGQLGRVQAHRKGVRQLTALAGRKRARGRVVFALEGVGDQLRRRLELQSPVRRD